MPRFLAIQFAGFFLLLHLHTALAQVTPNSRHSSDEERAAARNSTEQDFRSAKPHPLPVLPGSEYDRLFGPETAPKSREVPETLGQKSKEDVAAFARINVNKVPFNRAGQMFFLEGSARSACSAQFTADPRVIVTASHCVQKRDGTWRTHFVFVQRYEDGEGVRIPYTCVANWPMWVADAQNSRQWDYAFLLMDIPSDAGVFGLQTFSAHTSIAAIGYPTAMGGGLRMQMVQGARGLVANNIVELVQGEPRFTEGASGGAWIGDLTENPAGAGNVVISVTSHTYDSRPGRVYGPYFNNLTIDLFRFVQRGCR